MSSKKKNNNNKTHTNIQTKNLNFYFKLVKLKSAPKSTAGTVCVRGFEWVCNRLLSTDLPSTYNCTPTYWGTSNLAYKKTLVVNEGDRHC